MYQKAQNNGNFTNNIGKKAEITYYVHKFTSVSNVPEGTNNGNLTKNIGKKAEITCYVELIPYINCEVSDMMYLHDNC